MKNWLKWLLTIIIFVGLTVALYFVGFKSEWVKPMIESVGIWGYFIYLILQVLITTVCCFVPATTFTFTIMAVQVFGITGGLIISIIGCWISSNVMFAVGRYGGVKLVDWLVGKDSREKAQRMVSDRAAVLVPVMLACPFFPDDALCMISGMTKMKWWYFAVISLITRSIGITATALLGNDVTINYIKNALGDNIVLWVLAVNVLLFDVWVIWKASGLIEQLLKKRREKIKLKEITEDKKEEEENYERDIR